MSKSFINKGVCSVDWCIEPVYCKGFCARHYNRQRKGIDMNLPHHPQRKHLCTHKGCHYSAFNIKKGGKLCRKHQHRKDNHLPMDSERIRKACAIEGCPRKVKNVRKGGIYCASHQFRIDNNMSLDNPPIGTRIRKKLHCTIPGCVRKHKGLGYCENHYRAFCLYGDPLGKPKPRQPRPACAVESCNRESMTISQYCVYHRDMNVKWGSPLGKRCGVIISKTKCAADGCNEFAETKGWCSLHNNVFKRYGFIPATYKPKLRARCSTTGCEYPVRAKGLCSSCYQKHRKQSASINI